jgi:hypothetical protein
VPTNLADAIGAFPGLAAVLGIGIILQTVAPVVGTWIKERARTSRFAIALKNSEPSQRADIIRACGGLDAGPDDQPGSEGS